MSMFSLHEYRLPVASELRNSMLQQCLWSFWHPLTYGLISFLHWRSVRCIFSFSLIHTTRMGGWAIICSFYLFPTISSVCGWRSMYDVEAERNSCIPMGCEPLHTPSLQLVDTRIYPIDTVSRQLVNELAYRLYSSWRIPAR
jgi:hypothetical protein